MRFLLIEDDHLQAAGIRSNLKEAFPSAEFDTISTESEFRSRFDEIKKTHYDVAIVDVMLRWANPAPQMPEQPEDVRKGGFFRAGLRCRERLEGETKIPVVIYTVLNSSHLPEGTDFVEKSGDLSSLVEKIKEVLKTRVS